MNTYYGNPTSGEFLQAERKTSLYVLVVALIPIILPTIVSTVVFLVIHINSIGRIGATTEYASIEYPVPGVKVSEDFVASGSVFQKPENSLLFVSAANGEKYWPKAQIHNQNWTVNLSAPGAGGYKYDLVVIAVSQQDAAFVNKWFDNGNTTGNYPPIENLKNIQILARVRVEK